MLPRLRVALAAMVAAASLISFVMVASGHSTGRIALDILVWISWISIVLVLLRYQDRLSLYVALGLVLILAPLVLIYYRL